MGPKFKSQVTLTTPPFWGICHLCLQCFDTVGWVSGRASGL